MSSVLWYRVDDVSSNNKGPKPLVVILAWMQAQERHVKTYAALNAKLGWETAALLPPTLSMWLPTSATRLARTVLDALLAEIAISGPRPIVFAIFSGAAKAVYYKLIVLLLNDPGAIPVSNSHSGDKPVSVKGSSSIPMYTDRYALLRGNCLCGEVFDSSPIDFLSSHGVRFLAPPGAHALRAAAVRQLGVALDLFVGREFERQRVEQWAALERSDAAMAAGAPTLLLLSDDDPLADPGCIRAFAERLRARREAPPAGREGRVRVVAWEQSEHVGHLRRHPVEYEAALASCLEAARAAWKAQQQQRLRAGSSDDVAAAAIVVRSRL